MRWSWIRSSFSVSGGGDPMQADSVYRSASRLGVVLLAALVLLLAGAERAGATHTLVVTPLSD